MLVRNRFWGSAYSAHTIGASRALPASMKSLEFSLALSTLIVAGTLGGCAAPVKSADIYDGLKYSLYNAGLKDVSVNQDRDKGVVTLGGHVPADRDKSQAESIAKSMAGNQVVANQIVVVPAGGERDAKAVSSDIDQGIEKNLDAALIQNNLRKNVKFSVKSGVVTLTGEVNSQSLRTQAERIASPVPNVQQVVNELQVKDQKATSSN
jgi:osmotically-inducible protein OsmY